MEQSNKISVKLAINSEKLGKKSEDKENYSWTVSLKLALLLQPSARNDFSFVWWVCDRQVHPEKSSDEEEKKSS